MVQVTIVQPVLACGVVVVLLLSRVVLRERLGRGELCCVAGMTVAVVLLALSSGGRGAGVGHDVSALRLAAVVTPSCLLGLLVCLAPARAAGRKHRGPTSGVSYGVGTGLLYGVTGLAIKALSGLLVRGRGAGHVLLAVASSPYLYLFAIATAAGFVFFQTALQRCRASILVPVSNITGSVYFMAAGSWLFHEQLPRDQAGLAMRLTGIVIACAVLVTLPRLVPNDAAAVVKDPARYPGTGSSGMGGDVGDGCKVPTVTPPMQTPPTGPVFRTSTLSPPP